MKTKKESKESFADLLESFGYKYDLHRVFDDFLTMSLCAVTQHPLKHQSCYEDLYLEAMKSYKTDPLRFYFPKMFAALVVEMEELLDSCNDVLGNFYEMHLYKKGAQQYFTPWTICEFMARCTADANGEREVGKTLRIIDPCCGSGRMLLAGAKVYGKQHEYYGIDIDPTCVKMTALNLFLNGIFNAEVMCANALAPDDFQFSYRTSFLPFGVFRIEEKGKSLLWHLMQFNGPIKNTGSGNGAALADLKLPSEDGDLSPFVQQLHLF